VPGTCGHWTLLSTHYRATGSQSKTITPGAMWMPRKFPLHVERNRVKGKNYYSFRKGKGPRIRLPDDPTSDEFREAYLAAMRDESSQLRVRKLAPALPLNLVITISSGNHFSCFRR
jgi:hypothetical protein